MTTAFDAPDNSAAAATLDPTAIRLQADYQLSTAQPRDAHIVKVADQTAAPQAGDGQPQGGGDENVTVKDLVSADPSKLPPDMKSLQGLASHFDKTTDKAQALSQVKPEVEKIIAAADKAQADAETKANTEMATLKPKLDKDQADLKAVAAPMQAAAGKVPEDDQKRVGAELGLLADDKTSPKVKQALEDDLAKYPGLLDAFHNVLATEKRVAPDIEQFQALKEAVEATADTPVVARMVYADMLNQGGDKAGAKQMIAESTALQMGMSIDDFHKLQQQQKPPKGN